MRCALVVAAVLAVAGEARGDEVIHIEQKITPIQMPRLLSDPARIPSYSDDAILSNAWVRAWVWLDIDADGVVQRVKFIKRPGHGLDQVAIDFALSREFAPAVNQFGHKVRAFAYMPIEWPSHSWLVEKKYSAKRLAGLTDMIQISVDFTAAGGPPSQITRGQLPPCTLNAPLPLDKLQTASGIPLVYRDCSRPDLSHASAAEPWVNRHRDP
jgi:hypothetical protein